MGITSLSKKQYRIDAIPALDRRRIEACAHDARSRMFLQPD
jgi:hypothetical protein